MEYLGYDLETNTWFEPDDVVFISLSRDEYQEAEGCSDWKCPTLLPDNRDIFMVDENGKIRHIPEEEFKANLLVRLCNQPWQDIDEHTDKLEHQTRDVLEMVIGNFIGLANARARALRQMAEEK